MSSKAAFGFVCLAGLACAASSEAPRLADIKIQMASSPMLLLEQAQPVPGDDARRHRRLLELFAEVGCQDVAARQKDPSEPSHVVCTLPGESSTTILVSASFDGPRTRSSFIGTRRRLGRPDGWLGAAMLPSLYRSLGVAPRQHSYTFVGFSDEAHERADSRTDPLRSLELLPSWERRNVVALVNLKVLHLDMPGVWEDVADPDLHLDLLSVSHSLQLPVRPFEFRRRSNTPIVLRWHGMTPTKRAMAVPVRRPPSEVPSILIGVADLQMGEYLDSFRLVAAYLSYMDQSLEMRRRRLDRDSAEHTPPAPAERP